MRALANRTRRSQVRQRQSRSGRPLDQHCRAFAGIRNRPFPPTHFSRLPASNTTKLPNIMILFCVKKLILPHVAYGIAIT